MNLLYVLLTVVIFVLAAITRPGAARCPDDWYVELRSDRGPGEYECRPVVPPPHRESRGHEPEEAVGSEYDVEIRGRIYCSNGTRPIVVGDGRTVGCQRGGW